MPSTARRIDAFDLMPGQTIAGKYVVERKLGAGWEGEVYHVVETRTGVHRAAKLFFPHRNHRDRAVTFYAKKLERLRNCAMVIQYVHTETIRRRNTPITCLISEFVEGEIMSDYIRRQRGQRLTPFEALHLTYAVVCGLEGVHRVREYHGDIHDSNILVRRRGVFFDLKLLDFYHWGAPTAAHIRDDVADVVRLLYDAVGGKERYANQPPEIKAICRGLRRDLIGRAFPTARHLREHLESFNWE
ncbi:MAG: protein kinase [Phycisphaerales bacterium]|nr:protein kinase [Phycisphaerae bacterium]NNF42333.1 protein kinase [Phycisphaerales bacterium]NNM26562.1 protein kinase [Phycisphaerales bacterium]